MENEYKYIDRDVEATPRYLRNVKEATGGVSFVNNGTNTSSGEGERNTSSGEGHTHENKPDLDCLVVGTEDDYIRIKRWKENSENEKLEPVNEKAYAGYADDAAHSQKSDEWLRRNEWLDQSVRTTDCPVFQGITVKARVNSQNGNTDLDTALLVENSVGEHLDGNDLLEENETTGISAAVLEAVSTGSADTIGELINVDDSADGAPEGSILVMENGRYVPSRVYREELDLLNSKVFPFTVGLFGGGTYEKGSTQVITLSWTYDRAVDSQSVNNEALATDIRTKQYSGVTTDTTYTLRAVCKTTVYTQSLTARFCLKKYYGVSSKGTLTNAEILSLSSAWAQPEQEATLFDCTGGKYPYYILPTSMAGGVGFWVGGLKNTDWTEEVRKVTNASGYEESYTVFRLTGIQTGILSIEVK